MSITLDQARALVAVAEEGSIARAATRLHKVHSAVIYALKGLEDALGIGVIDRSGYRAALTPMGERVLERCQRLLAEEAELLELGRLARAGHAPWLRVVFDGLLPVEPILAAVRAVTAASPLTRVALFSEFLAEVETRAEREEADVALAVVPFARPPAPGTTALALPPLASVLVAHAGHPLTERGADLAVADLEIHPFLTVRGSDQRLQMSTTALGKAAQFKLSDFHAKRVALLAGMGWGWMPEYLVADDLARGELVVLPWGPDRGRHLFRPTLRARVPEVGGRAVATFVDALLATGGRATT